MSEKNPNGERVDDSSMHAASSDPNDRPLGRDGHPIEVFGIVTAFLTTDEERSVGVKSGQRGEVKQIIPGSPATNNQPYLQVELEKDGRVVTLWTSHVAQASKIARLFDKAKAASETKLEERSTAKSADRVAKDVAEAAAAAWLNAAPRPLEEVNDTDLDFREQLDFLYPGQVLKNQRKNFSAQKKQAVLDQDVVRSQDAALAQSQNEHAARTERVAYLGDTRAGDADFAQKMEVLYPGRSKRTQSKAYTDEFASKLDPAPLYPSFPRITVGGIGLKREDRMKEILRNLRPGEKPLLGGVASLVIENTTIGTSGSGKDWTIQGGVFLITDERLTLNTRLVLSRNRREIQLADIQSVDVSTVGLMHRITVRTPAGPLMFDIARNKGDAENIRGRLVTAADAAKLNRHQRLQAVPTVVHVQEPSDRSAAVPSKASQLKELFELHQMGAISALEYEALKADIIDNARPD